MSVYVCLIFCFFIMFEISSMLFVQVRKEQNTPTAPLSRDRLRHRETSSLLNRLPTSLFFSPRLYSSSWPSHQSVFRRSPFKKKKKKHRSKSSDRGTRSVRRRGIKAQAVVSRSTVRPRPLIGATRTAKMKWNTQARDLSESDYNFLLIIRSWAHSDNTDCTKDSANLSYITFQLVVVRSSSSLRTDLSFCLFIYLRLHLCQSSTQEKPKSKPKLYSGSPVYFCSRQRSSPRLVAVSRVRPRLLSEKVSRHVHIQEATSNA